MDPHPFGFTPVICSTRRHSPAQFGRTGPQVLLLLWIAALVGCSDREVPTAVLPEPQRPTLTVFGADYVVTNTADAGAGSLRQAILDANAAGAAKGIAFDISSSDAGCSAGVCTITLASTLPSITNSAGMTIDGVGQLITISGGGTVRVMRVETGASLAIKNLTIANGGLESLPGAGVVNSGTLTVENSTFANNTGTSAGAITNFGTLTIRSSTFYRNRATADQGGAIWGGAGTITISNSTFSANSARFGGAIFSASASTIVSISSSTFIGNSVSGGQGAAIYSPLGTVSLSNTILAGNLGSANCVGGVTDGGYNLDDGTSCGFSAANNSKPSTNPLLDPAGLQSNGGPTRTVALESSSPAINAIPIGANGCGTTITTDQRGFPRPHGGGCDIGAFEFGASPPDATPPVVTPSFDGTLGSNGWYTSDVTVSWAVSDPESAVTSAPCAPTTITVDTPSQDVPCSATSAGGTTNVIALVKRDATAPTISFGSADPAPNAAGWNNTSVMATWSCTDAMSGPGTNFTVTQPIVTEGQNQSITGQCADAAGHTAQDTRSGINIDKTAPTLAPVVSPNPVLLNGTATATPNAADPLSGLVSSSCGTPTTITVGSKSVSCTATDYAGNTNTVAANYVVAWAFTGFLQPVDPMPTVNVVKAGSGVQVKFGLGGDKGLAIFAAGFPASQPVSCDASAPQDDVEATVTAGNSSLSYDASTQLYGYTWKTEKSWAGTCRLLSLTLVDGTTRQASFKLK